MQELTPRQIVQHLDQHIIGQDNAKRAVAIALRNRFRRTKLSQDIREEVYPKNLILIGPTGVGKTEIARRLAKLCGAPFLKVEATKFTEVGYVGRDVESIIRDLAIIALNLVKQEFREKFKEKAKERAEETILDILLPPVSQKQLADPTPGELERMEALGETRELMRRRLREGGFNDHEIEIELPKQNTSGIPMLQVFGGNNLEDIENQLQNILGDLSPKKSTKKKLRVIDALKQLTEVEADRLLDNDKVQAEAQSRVQESGIVFLDEIDKIAGRENRQSGDVSREGVQRDLLPIVEGSTVNTKIGPIQTDHILFIAAGAFHMTKPSDLIPELQGRFPIRVELESLTKDQFVRILTETKSSLTKQYQALLSTEGVELDFITSGIEEIANMATLMNEKNQNIGARRLNTILEKLLEDVSFDAPDLAPDDRKVKVDQNFVKSKLAGIVEDKDLSRFIL